MAKTRFNLIVIAIITLTLGSASCYAQFSGSIQGTVQDTSTALIAGATVTLVNIDTQVTQTTTTTSSGTYRFISLPPGNYTAEASKQGFRTEKLPVLLETGQLKNVAIVLTAGVVNSTVVVTTQAPLLDTSDSRSQLTLNSHELESLPNSTLSALGSLDIAPGVTGGVIASGAAGQRNAGLQNNLSFGANGRGQNGNLMVVDGISVMDSTRLGAVNLSPNLDAIQETSTQTNTYSVLNASTSSILIQMTTKSGTDKFHGSASEYYQYQGLNARGEYGIPKPTPQATYHTNNMSFTFGGPVPKVKQLFFFVAYSPDLQLNPSSLSRVNATNPSFITTYMTRSGNPSPEVADMLEPYNLASSKFVPQDQTNPDNYQTAAQVFNNGTCPDSGFLGDSYLNVPCSAVVNEYGFFNAAGSTNAMQYSFRVDKTFQKDRLYVSFFRNTAKLQNPALLLSQGTYENDWQYALQGNETHTFSPNLLNAVTIGATHIYGVWGQSLYNYVPGMNVGGMNGSGLSNGGGEYLIESQRYRDLLIYNHGNHSISMGGDFVHNATPPTGPSYYLGIPQFHFNNPYDAAYDSPYQESGLQYNLATGAPSGFTLAFAQNTFDFFAEDDWKVTPRLTINYGIRYDNFGNLYPLKTYVSAGAKVPWTMYSIQLPQSGSFQEQIESSYLTPTSHALAHDLNWNFGPRVGFAYGLQGNGKSVLRGGIGLYHDWFNMGNGNQLSSNPPNAYSPTFIRGVTATQPQFSVGTSNAYPFGYTYPSVAGVALDAKGGVPGSFIGVGGPDYKNLKAPATINWSLGVEHQILPTLTASVLYAGSHSYDQYYGRMNQNTGAGIADVNVYDGDTIQHPIFNSNGTWQKAQQGRLNTSFGGYQYTFNGARDNYQSFVAAVRGRFGANGFMDVSYTHGNAKDDETPYYNAYQPNGSWNANSQYGPSSLDVPNRISIAASYQLNAFTHGNRFLRKAFSGYRISTIARFQTGTPLTVTNGNGLNLIDTVPGVQLTSTNYASELAAGHVTFISIENLNSPNVVAAFAAGTLASNSISGDYLGDGNKTALPNVNSYAQARNRKAYQYKCPVSQSGCPSSIKSSQFSTPAFAAGGTQGTERQQQFRNPGYGDVDLALEKNTLIWEGLNLRLRVDYFNALNRSNWNGLDGNLADFSTTFGTTSGTSAARVGQLSAKISF